MLGQWPKLSFEEIAPRKGLARSFVLYTSGYYIRPA